MSKSKPPAEQTAAQTSASAPESEACTPAALTAREIILQRRSRFVAAALAGLAGVSGCDDSLTQSEVCLLLNLEPLDGAPNDSAANPDAGARRGSDSGAKPDQILPDQVLQPEPTDAGASDAGGVDAAAKPLPCLSK